MTQTIAAYILFGGILVPLAYETYRLYCIKHNKQPKGEWSYIVYAVVLLIAISILIKDLF